MKLCLIGSSRFKSEYDELNKQLTLAGHVVYSICMVSTSKRFQENDADKAGRIVDENITADDKMILDLVHLRKIAESEGVVLVTDEARYIGFSTRREMIWARMIGRPIYGPVKEEDESFGDLGMGWASMDYLLDPRYIRG